MPELPEVEALAGFLRERATGRAVAGAEVGAIWALKSPVLPDALTGHRVAEVVRRGKWLTLRCTAQAGDDGDGRWLCVHLARAGWLRWYEKAPEARLRLGNPRVALRVRLDDDAGFDLTEAGTHKRLAIHVVDSPAQVEPIASLGVEPLSAAFTVEALAALLASRNQQVKGLLRDQRVVAGIGNAYSDEILLVARTSPFALTGSFDAEKTARLHAAVLSVLGEAVATATGRPAAQLKDAKRRGMRVHGRTGQPCPGWDGEPCGDTVREVSFADSSLQYCPTCQNRGKPLADRRMSRLLR